MNTHALVVPYRSSRALVGSQRFAGLAGSSKKRNWDAFNSTYPGTYVNGQGNYVLPAKFGGVVINQGQLDDLSGTWYGATYHPDGDQAGWQKKFDAVLQQIGAFNAFYNVQPTPTPTPVIPVPITPTPSGPVQVAPAPTITPTPTPTTLPAVGNAPPITVNVPPSVPATDTSALIQQLLAQGASQQQAFAAALQSLAAQGVQATPQVQQQVASDIANAGQPQQASTMMLALGVVAVIGLGIFLSRRKRR